MLVKKSFSPSYLWLLTYNSGNVTINAKERFLSIFFPSSSRTEVIQKALDRRKHANVYLALAMKHEHLYFKDLENGSLNQIKELWPTFEFQPSKNSLKETQDYAFKELETNFVVVSSANNSIEENNLFQLGNTFDSNLESLKTIFFYNKIKKEKIVNESKKNFISTIESLKSDEELRSKTMSWFRSIDDKGKTLREYQNRAEMISKKETILNDPKYELEYLKNAIDPLVLAYLQKLAIQMLDNEYYNYSTPGELLFDFIKRRHLIKCSNSTSINQLAENAFHQRFKNKNVLYKLPYQITRQDILSYAMEKENVDPIVEEELSDFEI